MAEPLSVLLVEDSPDDARLLERALRGGGLDAVVTRVETAAEMAAALDERSWHVVLADYSLPGFGAMPALELLRASGLDIPFIVVSGAIGEERAVQILQAGARDFLLKDRLARLAPVVRRELREARIRRERDQAAELLERERARHSALIRNASDSFWVLDADGTVRFSSPSVAELLGRSTEELLGSSLLTHVHEPDRKRVQELLERTAAGGPGVQRMEYRLRTADGEVRHVESVARDLVDAAAVRGIVVNTRDITERKDLEEKLRQSQKMEAIGKLAGGIAHDFNNLLTVIIGNGEMTRADLEAAGLATRDADQLLEAAVRAAALTRQLLAFSRQQVLQPRIVDVRSVVQKMVDMLDRIMGDDVSLRLIVPDEACPARVDPVQLEQVIMNLAVNAREVLLEGGRVEVEVDEVQLEEDAELPDGHYVRLCVRDDGPGMTEQVRRRIFEPFFSTKEEGTGLGLATVYGIVHQSGGKIQVDSTPGAGTTFHVLLPGSDEVPAGTSEARTVAGAAQGPLRRVLLVEDDPSVREVAARILDRSGLEVVAVDSGTEALERLDRGDEVDLLVTDLVMPEMSGGEVARRARSLRPELSVLFMSGYSGDEVLTGREVPEGTGFLQKPFTAQELLGRVRSLLNGNGG